MINFRLLFCLLTSLSLTYTSISSFEKSDDKECEIAVMRSFVEPTSIQQIVKNHYNIDEIKKVSLISKGVNDMYLVQTPDQKYVLRLSRVDKCTTMTESEFKFELEWLEFLHTQKVPVSYPIRGKENQLFGLITAPEGPRYFTLFSFAEGNTEMNVEQAFILGKTLAHLHITSDRFETSLTREHLSPDNLIQTAVQRLKNFFEDNDTQKLARIEELAAQLTKEFSNLDLSQLNYGIIGGDNHGFNQHFKDNVITLFDFEFCAYGYRIYDIATFKWSRGSQDTALWEAFLAGYQVVLPLNPTELQAIDHFAKARNFWWMGTMASFPETLHKLDEAFWKRAFNRF